MHTEIIRKKLYIFFLMCLFGVLSAAAYAGPAGSPAVDALLQKAQQAGSVRVIVGVKTPSFQPEAKLRGASAVAAQRSAISAAQQGLLNRTAGVQAGSVKRFSTIPFLALQVTAEGLAALAADPEVTSIEEDRPVPANLTESVPLVRAPEAWSAGASGSGVAVAVLDTGVDKNHPLLSGKVVSEACYSTTDAAYSCSSVCPGGVESSTAAGSAMPYGGNCPAGECDHGTHVAGIAAGAASGSYTYNGVAKDADIIAVQVFSRFDSDTQCGAGASPCALTWSSDQVLGLERVYALRSTYTIAAVNMSLGGGRYYDQASCDAANASTKAAIDNLRAAGIATIISSGNSGYTDSMGSPGCISSAVSVGSTGDGSGGATVDTVSSFSNSVYFLNLLAPGQWITSCTPGDTEGTWQGTSMAAPHVAGAWAVLRSADATATVDEILAALGATGVSVTDARNSVTKPRIRVKEALDALPSVTTSTSSIPTTSTSSSSTSTTTTLDPACGDISITHSSSEAVTGANSVNCGSSGHADNSYWRAFSLTDFGITEDFNVCAVEIGVEQAAAGSGGSQPVTVRLYTSSEAFPGGYPDSLTLIGQTADVSVPDQTFSLFTLPVSATAPAGSELVVEIFTPNGQTEGNSFYIGSNAAAETGPSYLSAADCGITSPTDLADIGFPDMHIVMTVLAVPSSTTTVEPSTTTSEPDSTTTVPDNSTTTTTVSDNSTTTTTVSDNSTTTTTAPVTTTVEPGTTTTEPVTTITTTLPADTTTVPVTTTVAPGSTTSVSDNSTTTTTVPDNSTTTTTASVTTTAPGSSTTTVAPGSTTTVAPGSTTTVAPGSTTTVAPGSTTTVPDNSTTTTTEPGATTTVPATTTAPASTTTTTVSGGPCPAQKVLGDNNPKLNDLRTLRDGILTRSAVGRRLIRLYYANAGSINAALDRSPALRACARRLFIMAAQLAEKK